jgi:hypothetical protein
VVEDGSPGKRATVALVSGAQTAQRDDGNKAGVARAWQGTSRRGLSPRRLSLALSTRTSLGCPVDVRRDTSIICEGAHF